MGIARSDAELTLELIRTKLSDEMAKRGMEGNGESELKADAAKRKKMLVRNYCQKPGHKQRQCRSWIVNLSSESEPDEQQEKQHESKANE